MRSSAAWRFDELALRSAQSRRDGEAGYSDDEEPGHSNMRCPLLEAVYHHSIGGYMAICMCRSKAALSQPCHFAVFVLPQTVSSRSAANISRRSAAQSPSACDAGMSVGPCHRNTAVGARCPDPTLQESCG